MAEQVNLVNKRLKEISEIAGLILTNPETDSTDMEEEGTDVDVSSERRCEYGESLQPIKQIKQKADEAMIAMVDLEKLLSKRKESKELSWRDSLPSLPWSDKKLQVYVPEITKSTKSFLAEFTKSMKKKNVILDINCDVSRMQTGALLVVCPNLSRLQPDIDSCLKGIQNREQMVVLVLHFQRESTLPKLPSATQLAMDAKYNNIQFIDMAFDENIYDCEMNRMAKDQLTEFIGKL